MPQWAGRLSGDLMTMLKTAFGCVVALLLVPAAAAAVAASSSAKSQPKAAFNIVISSPDNLRFTSA
jgi:hypothetical protein